MGEQEGFVKAGFPNPCTGIDSHASKRREALFQRRVKGEGHQTGPGFRHREAELFGNLVTERTGPHFGNRFAAAGNDQVAGPDCAAF